jgi:hypothetical protein
MCFHKFLYPSLIFPCAYTTISTNTKTPQKLELPLMSYVSFASSALCAPHTLLIIFANANTSTTSPKQLLVSSIDLILRVWASLKLRGLEPNCFMPIWFFMPSCVDDFHWAWC